MYTVTVFNKNTNTRSRTMFASKEDQEVFINGIIEGLEIVLGFDIETKSVNNSIIVEYITITFTLEH